MVSRLPRQVNCAGNKHNAGFLLAKLSARKIKVKIKKILSLVLALVFVFALAAPAFAAVGDDEAELQGVAIPCERCSAPAYRTSQTERVVIRVNKGNCSAKPDVGH